MNADEKHQGPMEDITGEITLLVRKAVEGSQGATDDLFRAIHDKLMAMAESAMANA